MHPSPWFCIALLSTSISSCWAAGDGITAENERPTWAHWQGRVALGKTVQSFRLEPAGASEAAAGKLSSLSAIGDYYFTGAIGGASNSGGFRATSGLVVGARSQLYSGLVPSATGGVFNVDRRVFGQGGADSSSETASLSYVGLGYTGLSSRSGWSFSADLGLVSMNAGTAVKLGRAFNGSTGVDDLVRDARLSRVVQLAVSYSF